MGKNVPKVSVIIPVFNRSAIVHEAIDSVLAQEFDSFEVVVVDDGSTDGTSDVVRERFPDVRLVEQDNQGAPAARNTGARNAQSEILIFFDSDDLMLPQALQTLYEMITSAPELTAAFTDHQLHDAATGILNDHHHGVFENFDRLCNATCDTTNDFGRIFFSGRLYHRILSGNFLQQPWAIRRTQFLSIGGYNEAARSSSDDWELYIRIVRECTIIVSDKVISTHRVGQADNQLTGESKQRQEHFQTKILKTELEHANKNRDRRAAAICKKRLANYYKSFGDRTRPDVPLTAWKHYFRSASLNPLDHVVLARLLLWAPGALASLFRGQESLSTQAESESP